MSERIGQRMDVAVGVIVRHGGRTEPCMSRTLSQRGMFIATPSRWPIGTVVGVEIVHQDMRIVAQARVAVATHNGVGLEFVDESVQLDVNRLLTRFVPSASDEGNRVNVGDLHVYWAPEPEDGQKKFWRDRRRKVRLIDLSLDGAAFVDKKPPEIGEPVIVSLPNPLAGADEFVDAPGKVVRHTERGFAVQFSSPSQAFRRAISEIRKAARAKH